jgi:hypothetical protein
MTVHAVFRGALRQRHGRQAFYLPVSILSTSSLTVGINPFE